MHVYASYACFNMYVWFEPFISETTRTREMLCYIEALALIHCIHCTVTNSCKYTNKFSYGAG